MANVRKATLADIPALLAMSVTMHAESPRFRGLQFSSEKMRGLIGYLLPGKNGGVLVAEQAGEVIGMLGFLVSEHFFGPDKFASDLGIYVKPEHRGSSAFLRLVREFEVWADALGAQEKVLCVSTGVHPERTTAALERLGYSTNGVNLLKRNGNV